jgi:hypothetical protein
MVILLVLALILFFYDLQRYEKYCSRFMYIEGPGYGVFDYRKFITYINFIDMSGRSEYYFVSTPPISRKEVIIRFFTVRCTARKTDFSSWLWETREAKVIVKIDGNTKEYTPAEYITEKLSTFDRGTLTEDECSKKIQEMKDELTRCEDWFPIRERVSICLDCTYERYLARPQSPFLKLLRWRS